MKHVSLLWDYFQFSPTKRRHLSRFKNYIFDPRGDTLCFALFNRRREKHREGGKFSATSWISSAIRGSRSAVSRNEVTRPEPSLSASAAFSIRRYLETRYTRRNERIREAKTTRRIPSATSSICSVSFGSSRTYESTYLWTESSSSAAAESLEVSLYLASGIVARAG